MTIEQVAEQINLQMIESDGKVIVVSSDRIWRLMKPRIVINQLIPASRHFASTNGLITGERLIWHVNEIFRELRGYKFNEPLIIVGDLHLEVYHFRERMEEELHQLKVRYDAEIIRGDWSW